MVMGLLLALGSGVYIHIACCECIVRVKHTMVDWKDSLFVLVLFATGVIPPIGLTLLGHVHCDCKLVVYDLYVIDTYL